MTQHARPHLSDAGPAAQVTPLKLIGKSAASSTRAPTSDAGASSINIQV